MKIAEYQKQLQQLAGLKGSSGKPLTEEILNLMDIWNSDACLGYAATALQAAGVGQETYKQVIGFMKDAMETYTVDDAAKMYAG